MRWLGYALAAAAVFSAEAGTVVLLDGTVHEGELSLDGGIVVRGATSAKVDLRAVLSATFADEKKEDFQPGLVLTDGTRIAGAFTSLTDDAVTVRGMKIATADVAWSVYQPFGTERAADLPSGKTGALLPDGDFFEGTVKAADAESAKVINPVFGPRTFRAKDKDALAVALRPFKPQAAGFEVVTKDGSRFAALDLIARDATGVVLRHARYDGLKIAADDIAEIRAHPTRYVALADLKPARTTGGDNVLSPAKSGRGMELRAGASASWDVQTAGGVLVTRIAPGSDTPDAQKLIFTVYADSKAVFRSKPVATGTASQPVRVTLPAAAKVTLHVEGLAGSGVWSDPVILRR